MSRKIVFETHSSLLLMFIFLFAAAAHSRAQHNE
jgi:hypothetical protein